MARIDAIREVQITEKTCSRWRKQLGGTGTGQLQELERLQKENERLSKAEADLTLNELDNARKHPQFRQVAAKPGSAISGKKAMKRGHCSGEDGGRGWD